jgi:hypothetical protein
VNGGNVSDKLHAGAVGGEVPLHQVRYGQSLDVRVCRATKRALLAGDQALITHDVANQLRGTLTAFINGWREYADTRAPIPAGSLRVFQEVMDPGAKRVTPSLDGRLGAAPPMAET